MDEDEPPLPASVMAPALIRQVTANGGFATVISKGSPWGSAMILVHRDRNEVRALELLPGLDGRKWQVAAEGDSAVQSFVASQQQFDPDLWVLELDTPDLARFIPGLPEVY